MIGGRPNGRVFFASIGALGVACARRPLLDEHPIRALVQGDHHDPETRSRCVRRRRDPVRAYCQGRKAPLTREAGREFEDPKHELSVEWLDTRARIRAASERQAAPATPSRVLLVCASARNDDTCPSEISKTFRLTKIAEEVLTKEKGAEVDLLDLSLLSSEYGKKIHPCKGCASTAMPLCHWPCSCYCHWPCSCYPNHSLGQTGDRDGRYLRAVHCGARNRDCDARVLVPGAGRIEGDDRSPGVRRRGERQP